MHRPSAIGLAALILGLGAAAAGVLMVPPPVAAPPPAAEAPRLILSQARFADLPGWAEDAQNEAWPALRLSCERVMKRKPDTDLGVGGIAANWTGVCAEALALENPDAAMARAFIEDRFTPVMATSNGAAEGLITGYYEPELLGALAPDATYATPLYRRPADLVQVDLGEFREELKGQRIAGRVQDGRLKPFEDRARIADGALGTQGLELAWVASPVDAFFLEIQGSGRVRMPDGSIMRVGFDGQNGHPYVALGKVMLEDGLLERGRVSMQSIKAWLNGHPDQAQALMNRNPSYVFFRDLGPGPGPLGAQGVALTPGRSLAVDRKFYPMGLPIWLDTTLPSAAEGAEAPVFRRLMVAQDTGGAIRGPVRGDVFFGPGAEAERLAGAMKQQGRWWLLLPNAVAATVAPPAD